MVIASILMSLGMMMLSPMLISSFQIAAFRFGRWLVDDRRVIVSNFLGGVK